MNWSSTEDGAKALEVLQILRTDPHALLGVRSNAAGVLFVRVWRPDAWTVSVRFADHDAPIALKESPIVRGLFEAQLTSRPAPDPYLVRSETASGHITEGPDAHAFWPTISADDLQRLAEGQHQRLWERLGARPMTHQKVEGVAFSVWAPNAVGVAVAGDFNDWDVRRHPMRRLGSSGVWEIFVPAVALGSRYKFYVEPQDGRPSLKADPLARRAELPPLTGSVVHALDRFTWHDEAWLTERAVKKPRPMSTYEVHLGSFMRKPEEGNRELTYRELAHALVEHCTKLHFTHVELMPIAEYPFGGSWGYQVTSYFAPTARYGTPDDFRYLVDTLHQAGIGVIVDWVPAHFPRDGWALAEFDGTALYEHADPQLGAHPDWGTLIFDFGRNEVRNFLIASALYWLEQYHLDGLRVDAVASMLYRDYSRGPGKWTPNARGGREYDEAIEFLRELNDTIAQQHPDALVIAEESTAWPGVTRATKRRGLGFTHKWNMGWMHDTLAYLAEDPVNRQHHHHKLTFGLTYAFSESFVLALSHDEVVHLKKSLLMKMVGDDWRRFANLRALFGWMWAHPGKKLLFMGGEFGQWREWNHDQSLDWHLLERHEHRGVMELVGRLNELYRSEGALFEADESPSSFQWGQVDDAALNTLTFVRRGRNAFREIVCVANFSPVVHENYRVGVPAGGWWTELVNTDDLRFGGSGVVNAPRKADAVPADGQPGSITITLPPLAVSWWAPIDAPEK